jgi:drug/metabolite transporter (DMT)-like permease
MYATWSIIFPLSKITLNYSTPVFLNGFRMVISGLILLGFLCFKNWRDLKINKAQILPLLSLSVFCIYLTNILEFWSMQYLSPVKVCFIYGLSPFFAVFFSYIHFNEKLNIRKIIGLCIGFCGFIPVMILQTGSEGLYTIISCFSWPDLAMVGAALFSTYGWVLLRIIVKNQTLSPIYANGYSMLFGGILSLIHSALIDSWNPLPIVSGKFYTFSLDVLIMILISNIFCYNLYGYLLKRFTTTLLSFFGLLSPIFASFISWILIGKTPSWIIFISTICVVFGLFIVYQTELKQGYISMKKPSPQTMNTI